MIACQSLLSQTSWNFPDGVPGRFDHVPFGSLICLGAETAQTRETARSRAFQPPATYSFSHGGTGPEAAVRPGRFFGRRIPNSARNDSMSMHSPAEWVSPVQSGRVPATVMV